MTAMNRTKEKCVSEKNSWCDDCGVTMELHDPTDDSPCEEAERRAVAMERAERLMFGPLS